MAGSRSRGGDGAARPARRGCSASMMTANSDCPDRPMTTLHFVYNVDATPSALLRDFVHRLVAPESYPCRLCDLTYGRFLKKAQWSRFVADLPIRARFHLRG